MENIKGPKLHELIINDEHITNNMMRSLLAQIFYTIIIMKKHKINHNDLHTNNIIVQKNNVITHIIYDDFNLCIPTYGNVIKIIDFGFAHNENTFNNLNILFYLEQMTFHYNNIIDL